MPDYRQFTIPAEGTDPPELPAVSAVPLQATSAAIAHQAMHALDTLPGSGHRVVFEFGLRGGDSFLVPDGVDPASPIRDYPDADTGRVVGRGIDLPLAPGHVLGLDVVALPSGPTQSAGVPPDYLNSGTGGRFELEVTYTNGDLDTVDASATITIPGSLELYGGEPSPAHANLFTASAIASPETIEPDTAHLEKFMRGNDVTAAWTLTAYGSPRPVDVAVVERGSGITVDHASTRWPSAMYVAAGQPYEQLPGDFPVEQITTTDPGGGPIAIGRALLEHGRQLGPCLGWFNSGTEAMNSLADWISYDGGTGDDETPPFTWVGGGETHIPLGVGIVPNEPGLLLGHYARQVEHGDDFLDGRTGVIPVWFAAYIKSTDASVTIRTDTVGWSQVTVSTTLGAFEWVIEPGYLEVGTGSEDAPVGSLVAHGDDNGELRYAAVFFRVTT